jgi:outer membrane protein assembly factor BamB
MSKINFLPLFILFSCLVNAQTQHPWPMFHGNQQHSGYADVVGPQSATVKWKYNLGFGGMNMAGNSIAISNTGTIYVGGPNLITALDSEGNLKWSKFFQGAQGPAISKDGSTIYIVADSNIYALDTLGATKWQYDAGGMVIFGVTLSEDDSVLYQGSWDKNVYALNTNDGSVKWKYLTYGCVSYPVTIATDGSIIVGGGDAHCGSDSLIYALNTDGTLKWKYKTSSLRSGSPAIGPDGLIYVPSSPTLYVLDNAGNLKWSAGDIYNETAGIITPAISSDTSIVLGTSKGVVSSFNGTTHATNWTYQTGEDPNQSGFYGVIGFPVVDKEGTTYVGAVDYKIYAFDKNGNVKWSYLTGGRISEASPALGSDGALYVTSDDGYLYAFADTTISGISLVNSHKFIQIFPNPTNGQFHIENTDNSIKSAEVHNCIGQSIYSANKLLTGNIYFDLSNQDNGVYFIRLETENGIVNEKLIIQK